MKEANIGSCKLVDFQSISTTFVIISEHLEMIKVAIKRTLVPAGDIRTACFSIVSPRFHDSINPDVRDIHVKYIWKVERRIVNSLLDGNSCIEGGWKGS